MTEVRDNGHHLGHTVPRRPIARFIHIADAREARRIARTGLRPGRGWPCVFCVPALSDASISFQWGRELKRDGRRASVAVTFLVPDSELVVVGRFGQTGVTMTATQAVAHFMRHENALGLEVRIPRRIEQRALRSIRPVPKGAGWRYYPEAKGARPFWPWPGEIKGRRLRTRIEAACKSPLASLLDDPA